MQVIKKAKDIPAAALRNMFALTTSGADRSSLNHAIRRSVVLRFAYFVARLATFPVENRRKGLQAGKAHSQRACHNTSLLNKA